MKWIGVLMAVSVMGCEGVLGIDEFKFVADCEVGKWRCAGKSPQECGSNGKWSTPEVPCRDGTHCEGGKCVVICTPGDLQCNGDQPQECDNGGIWQNKGQVCEPCRGCDEDTGMCAASYKDDGEPCTLSSDKCALTAECEMGECKAKTSIMCVTTEAGTCSLDACDKGTGICIPANGTPCDDHDVCTTSPSACQAGICASSPESSDHVWAQWTLPFPMPAGSERYTWTDDVVYDKVTHLVWQRKATQVQFTWEEAKTYCECLNDANCGGDKISGYPSGWRLPTRIELASIVDYEKPDLPSINEAAFPGTLPTLYWSASPFTGAPASAWYVSFSDGFVFQGLMDNPLRVRCVR